MKKITAIMICLVMTFSLVSCGNKSDISGNDKEGVFSSLIPSEVYDYMLQNREFKHTSNLKSIEIIRETVKDDIYDGTAKLTLDDEYICRSVELTLHGRKYDTGGWHLENYNIDNSEVIQWKEKCINEALEARYSEFWKVENHFSSDSNSGTVDLTYNSDYLDATGSLGYSIGEYSIKERDGYLNYSDPLHFSKSKDFTFNWKIDDYWMAEGVPCKLDATGFTTTDDGYYALRIDSRNDETIKYTNCYGYIANGETYMNEDHSGDAKYVLNNYELNVSDSCIEFRTNVRIGVSNSYTECIIKIHPNKATFKTIGYMYDEKEHILKKVELDK